MKLLHYNYCDIYTTLEHYKYLCNKMKEKERKRQSQWIIEETLLATRLREETGEDYTIRVSFIKCIDDHEDEIIAEKENLKALRETSRTLYT